jgi:23S rRNA pseudouridine1911/1915/1917 synthase
VRKEIEIIFEDAHLLVVNKPSGILVVPTPAGERHTLTARVRDFRKRREGTAAAFPCHRLDRDTSGLIIYAKTRDVQEKMMEAFKKRAVEKTYLAFVHGHPGKAEAVIEYRLEGQPAVTKYRILERKDGYSVVSVEPETGRTNQIRIHFKMIGHPLVGDRKFAVAGRYPVAFRRTALHAQKIVFHHPITGRRVSLMLDMPDDMKEFIARH